MPRNSSGTYTLPSGNPVVSGTLIEASWANTTLTDLSSAMTGSLSRAGEGGMTAALRLADGTQSLPGVAFTNETSSGIYRFGAGDLRLSVTGAAVAQFLATGVAVTGTLGVTGALTASGGVLGNVTGNVTGNLTGNATTATTAGNVSGTVAVANGGTGSTTAAAALVALGERTGATGALVAPAGTTAQRPTPAAGYFRFNTNLTKFEGYTGSAWGAIGGGASGGGSDEIFVENGQTVTTSYTITASKNAMSTGPITVNSGITVTVPTGSRWVVL